MPFEDFFKDVNTDNFKKAAHDWRVNVSINLLTRNRPTVPSELACLYIETDIHKREQILDKLFETSKELNEIVKQASSRRKELYIKMNILIQNYDIKIVEELEISKVIKRLLSDNTDIRTRVALENYFVQLTLAIWEVSNTILYLQEWGEKTKEFYIQCFSNMLKKYSNSLTHSEFSLITMFRRKTALSKTNIDLLCDIFLLNQEFQSNASGFLDGIEVQIINNVYWKNVYTKKLHDIENLAYKNKQIRTGNLIRRYVILFKSLPIYETQLGEFKNNGNDKEIETKLASYKKSLIDLQDSLNNLKQIYTED